MFRDRMKLVAIPERVYAICCSLKEKPMEKKALRTLVEPEGFAKTKYFGDVYAAAEQLGIVREEEGMVSLNISASEVESMEAFRKTVSPIIERNTESLFYKVTKAYLDLNEEVFQYNNVSEMCPIIQVSLNNEISIFKDDMRAWRFWVTYLGIGLLHEMIILPNMFLFLRDILEKIEMKKDKEYTIMEFLQMVQPFASFAIDMNGDKHLNLGLSNGIRQMNDSGIIELKYVLDSSDKWYLYKMEGHEYASAITHVTRRR